MASETGPPVDEAVLSVAFDHQTALLGPQMLMTLRDVVERFSRIEERPIYEMPHELPTEQQLSQFPQVPIRVIENASVSGHRYWLVDPTNDSILVQIQSDYLAVNWRRTKSSARYIGFDSLLAEFDELFGLVQDSVRDSGGVDLAVRQAELSYINVIHPNTLWSDHSDLSTVLSVILPTFGEFEQMSIGYTQTLQDDAGLFEGRLYSTAQTGYVANQENLPISQAIHTRLTPIIRINTNVRSYRLSQPSASRMRQFLIRAHDEADRTFNEITTDRAREYWGL